MTQANSAPVFPEAELKWFKQMINFRLLGTYPPNERQKIIAELPATEQQQLLNTKHVGGISPPDLTEDNSPYAWIVCKYNFTLWERFVLVLSLVPHLRPELLDVFHTSGLHTKFGGAKNGAVYTPSGETALYILADDDLELRFVLLQLFDDNHTFRKVNFLRLGEPVKHEPEWSGALVPSRDLLDLVMRGYIRPPNFGNDFPAKRITTPMSWEDLVLSSQVQSQVEEVKIWTRHRQQLFSEFGLGKRLKPGYKILFYGAPGTGKTLTACLLGQYTEQDVYRIDLSMIVSKYIGETEKNLSKVFDKAEHANWILFFDEADALFGSRTKVSSSNDRHANQEVSYLLQRIEDYPGIVILASNMKGNIDDAFMRRFTSVVHFQFPKSEERQLLWQKAIPSRLKLSEDVDLKQISDRYEMSGANITNIVAWCVLMALDKNDMTITAAMLREGMARELAKEGRTL